MFGWFGTGTTTAETGSCMGYHCLTWGKLGVLDRPRNLFGSCSYVVPIDCVVFGWEGSCIADLLGIILILLLSANGLLHRKIT